MQDLIGKLLLRLIRQSFRPAIGMMRNITTY